MFLGLPLRAWEWIGFLLACLALWAGLVWAVHTYNEHLREQGRAEVQAAWNAAKDRAQLEQDQIAADRRIKGDKDDAIYRATVARLAADAASSRDAAERLRQRVVQLVAAARRAPGTDPGAAGLGPGEQDSGALDLLAFMLSRTGQAATDIGIYADQLRATGERCERYGAMMVGLPQLSPPSAGDGPASPVSP